MQLCFAFILQAQLKQHLKLWKRTVGHYHGKKERDVRVKLFVKRQEKGDDEGLRPHLTLKVIFLFDTFSSSFSVTLTRHEQSTSGSSSLWRCVLTTSVQVIFRISAMADFLKYKSV